MQNFILYVNPEVALACLAADAPLRFSLDTAAALTGIHPALLKRYTELGVVTHERSSLTEELVFGDHALEEIRRIEAYRRRYSINLQALPLVCELTREIERLQAEIESLRP